MFRVERSKVEFKKALNTLALARMTPAKRMRVLERTAKAIIRDARRNTKQQKTVDNKSFTKRVGKGKKKLLAKMARRLDSDLKARDKIVVGYKNKGIGVIANRQQRGLPEKYTAARLIKLRKKSEKPNLYKQPANKSQAKRLISAGFKVRRKSGKGYKRPSLKWVTDNLNQGQFGAIYRELTNKKTRKRWTVTPAARPFLGLTDSEAQALLETQIEMIMGWK